MACNAYLSKCDTTLDLKSDSVDADVIDGDNIFLSSTTMYKPTISVLAAASNSSFVTSALIFTNHFVEDYFHFLAVVYCNAYLIHNNVNN